jgi:hypothetical protein
MLPASTPHYFKYPESVCSALNIYLSEVSRSSVIRGSRF